MSRNILGFAAVYTRHDDLASLADAPESSGPRALKPEWRRQLAEVRGRHIRRMGGLKPTEEWLQSGMDADIEVLLAMVRDLAGE